MSISQSEPDYNAATRRRDLCNKASTDLNDATYRLGKTLGLSRLDILLTVLYEAAAIALEFEDDEPLPQSDLHEVSKALVWLSHCAAGTLVHLPSPTSPCH